VVVVYFNDGSLSDRFVVLAQCRDGQRARPGGAATEEPGRGAGLAASGGASHLSWGAHQVRQAVGRL
jgi:hypothetical protein